MSTLRKFATPLTIGSFLIVGITGTLWYFHIITAAGRWLHEIIGLAMMAIVALHVWLNWRAFSCYFKRPLALAIMGVSAVVLIGGYVLPEEQGGRGPGGPVNLAAVAPIAAAPLSDLAVIYGASVSDLTARLDAAGYPGADASTSVADLTGTDARTQLSVLGALSGK